MARYKGAMAKDAAKKSNLAGKDENRPLEHLYLVDGSGFLFRAFHALPPMSRPDGTPINAVYGFTTMLMKLVEDAGADHLAVIFDTSRKTFRSDIYPDYKAHRPPPPDDLIPQFPLVREAAIAFNLPTIELKGYEADDLIATYAKQAREMGARVTIISSDKDLMQLVREGVELLDPIKNKPIRAPEVMEKFGVAPDKVIDVQALIGDSTDNVPGVKGIGPKTAADLITRYGSLERLLADDDKWLTAQIKTIQAKLDKLCGVPNMPLEGGELGRVLAGKFKQAQFEGAKGKFKAPTGKDLDELCAGKDKIVADFAATILDIRAHKRNQDVVLPKIRLARDVAAMSRKLVELMDNVPVERHADSFDKREPDPTKLIPWLEQQGFKSLLAKAKARFGELPEGYVRPPVPVAATPAAPASAAQPAEPEVDPPAKADAPIDRGKYELITDTKKLATWAEAAMSTGAVAVDTETDSLDELKANLIGISLALPGGRACYIPLGHRSAGTPGQLDFGAAGQSAGQLLPGQIKLADAVKTLKPMLEHAGVLKIGQNIKYDYKVLRRHGMEVSPVDDTMLLSFVLEGGLHGHGMDDLARMFLKHETIKYDEVTGTGKGRITFDQVPLDKARDYAAEDADVTFRLWRQLKPRLVGESMVAMYEQIERPLIQVLADMEGAGIKVDEGQLKRLSVDFAQRMAELEKQIHKLAGHPFNIGSPKQLGEVLFDEMKLEGGEKGKTGAYATGADVLETLAAQGHDLPARVLEWRQLAKLKSTYADALVEQINPQTKRVHTSYHMTGAATGRLASTDPNLQNIPVRTEEGRKIRKAFIAEKGNKLLSADYSQIELRLLAHVAGIDTLKQAFADGQDIHAITAAQVFGVPVKGMDPQVRRKAKAINFVIIYGISAFGLAAQLGIAQKEAGEYIKAYFARYPGIRDYIEETKAYCRKHGYVMTPFGRKIHLRNINDANQAKRGFSERAAINAPLQGGAADIIKRAMIRVPGALAGAKLKARMLLQVHDELLFEVPAKEVDRTASLVKKVMEDAAHLSVPLVVDTGAADDWAAAH